MDRNRNDTFQQTRFDIERREGQSQEILREASLKFPQMHGEVLDQPCSLSYEFRHFVVSLVAETDERVIKVRVPLVVRKFRAGFHRFGSVRLRKEQATRVLERCIRLVLGRVAWFMRSFGVQTRIPIVGPCVFQENGVLQVAFQIPLDVNYDQVHAQIQSYLELHSQNLDRTRFEDSRLADRMKRWLVSPNIFHRMAVPRREDPHTLSLIHI